MFERISRRERLDLLIAWVAISIAFAIIFIAPGGFLGFGIRVHPLTALLFFMISFLTVGIGFVFHEMAHKFSAMHYGYWAEFRKDDLMLLVAIVMAAAVGFVFAAPGATVIYSNSPFRGGLGRRENGIISAAGPAINLLLCIPFALLLLITGGTAGFLSGSLLSYIGLIGLQVNAMLAAFNMLPVSILDGRKILSWNTGVFLVLIIAAFGTLYASFVLF